MDYSVLSYLSPFLKNFMMKLCISESFSQHQTLSLYLNYGFIVSFFGVRFTFVVFFYFYNRSIFVLFGHFYV